MSHKLPVLVVQQTSSKVIPRSSKKTAQPMATSQRYNKVKNKKALGQCCVKSSRKRNDPKTILSKNETTKKSNRQSQVAETARQKNIHANFGSDLNERMSRFQLIRLPPDGPIVKVPLAVRKHSCYHEGCRYVLRFDPITGRLKNFTCQ